MGDLEFRNRILVKHISSGSPFEEKIGYSRAVVDGDMVYVSGSTGYDYKTNILPDDVIAQTRNTLLTISKALGEANCTLNDVVRVRYYLKNIADLDGVMPLLAQAFAKAKPAATLIVCDLIEAKMKIEIEVSARVGAFEA
ncbi:MAG: RidA family protein [Devosiaceae bacterium]|nr:RidA family protein [Devosiaceae bacterium]